MVYIIVVCILIANIILYKQLSSKIKNQVGQHGPIYKQGFRDGYSEAILTSRSKTDPESLSYKTGLEDGALLRRASKEKSIATLANEPYVDITIDDINKLANQ